jgi:hypothetical protein
MDVAEKNDGDEKVPDNHLLITAVLLPIEASSRVAAADEASWNRAHARGCRSCARQSQPQQLLGNCS